MDENTLNSNNQNAGTAGKYVLCIEDEPHIGELYKRALVNEGYQVDLVYDGNDGLAAALTDKYDIILLDIMIPGQLGIDLLRNLRAQKPDLKAKVIIITNLEQDDKSKRDVEDQADGYIIKAEVTPKQLVEYLNNF